MADKLTPLVLDALGRAAADPAGLPLFAARAAPGLFAATAPARLAAQHCKDQGLLRVVRTEVRGKAAQEICALTEKGLAHLLAQVSPRQVLEDLTRSLRERQGQAAELQATVQQWQAGLDVLRAVVDKALQDLAQLQSAPAPSANGAEPSWPARAVAYLTDRQAAGATGDCPLPELYQKARQAEPGLTVGRFHDGLRRLREQGRIYLHPWTGPLYDLPEPTLALLAGHEVAFYASPRPSDGGM